MAGHFDREAIARAHHKFFCLRYDHECTEVDQFDYDYADELAEIVSLIPQTEDGAATPPAVTGGVRSTTGAPVGAGEAVESASGIGVPLAAPSSATGPGPAVIGGQPGPAPRRFRLYRHTDISHVSGVGVVAWGVQFPDGSVAIRWHGAHPSTVAWASVEDAIAVHGHSGATEIQWLDNERRAT